MNNIDYLVTMTAVKEWAMFCWEILGPGITYVDVNQTLFPKDSDLLQQSCYSANTVQKRFKERKKKLFACPQNFLDLNLIEILQDVLNKQLQSMETPPSPRIVY